MGWRFSLLEVSGSGLFVCADVGFCGMTWMHIRDGRIVEGWDNWNQESLMQQLQNG